MLSHPENGNDLGPWYEGSAGERIAVRLSSIDTNGAYAIVESVAAPGYSPPMHVHRNEDEHFVVLAGAYRILIEDKLFDAPVGISVMSDSRGIVTFQLFKRQPRQKASLSLCVLYRRDPF